MSYIDYPRLCVMKIKNDSYKETIMLIKTCVFKNKLNYHISYFFNVVYITINVFIWNFHVGGCLSQNY